MSQSIITTHVIQIVFRLTRCQLSCMNVANDKNTKYFSELLNQNDEYDMETILEDAAETGRIWFDCYKGRKKKPDLFVALHCFDC